jgi:hopanoid C-2 methylase
MRKPLPNPGPLLCGEDCADALCLRPTVMRTRHTPSHSRRILCVYPRYARSFGTFQHAYGFFGGRVRAFMPPQGLLVAAAYLPEGWSVRFVDENSRAATVDDFRWADAVFVSGMHIQRAQIRDIIARAHAQGRTVIVGGPSVSGCPEYYPEADILHVGELGDATDQLIEHLDRSPGRPPHQLRFETAERLPLAQFPTPAYELIAVREYFIANIQFSSGCPYACEFCDIPALYGRNPRLKTPAQVLAELDLIAAAGATSVYFVDDNFIGNQKAALDLLPHLVDWQVRNQYPLRFACEATLNIAKNERVLELMREAGFITVFCGIETPEPQALHAISKDQNLRMPILDSVQRINSYGLEVVSGIILGLDTDTADTADRVITFIAASNIPLLTINILYALPKTPLWRRLEAEGRLVSDAGRESNVDFKLPYETVLEMWRRCITAAYRPEAVYARFAHNIANTFSRRKKFPANPRRASWANVHLGLGLLTRLIWRVGIRGDYRRTFWRLAWPALKAGEIESLIHAGVVSHHLIEFTRDCLTGVGESSFYAARDQHDPALAAPAPARAAQA